MKIIAGKHNYNNNLDGNKQEPVQKFHFRTGIKGTCDEEAGDKETGDMGASF